MEFLKDGKLKQEPLRYFLENECDESLHEAIRTTKDIEILKNRVRPNGHPDLKGALFISALVKPVAGYNEKAINRLAGKLFVSRATHIQAMSTNFKPKIDKISGRIGSTQYVNEHLKTLICQICFAMEQQELFLELKNQKMEL